MRIEQLAREFSAAAQLRGAEYHRAGRVAIRQVAADAVAAIARGTRDYDVRLEARGRLLRLVCSCPAFEDGPCKHLWSLVLAASERGALALLSACDRVALAAPPGDDEIDDDIVFQDEEDDDGTTDGLDGAARPLAPSGLVARLPQRSAPLLARGGLPVAPEPVPEWQARLFPPESPLLARPAAPPPAPRDLLYVVEVDRSRHAGELTISLRTRTAKKTGGFTKDKPVTISVRGLAAVTDEHDRRALPLFNAAGSLEGGGGGFGSYVHTSAGLYFDRRLPHEARIPPLLGADLLPVLGQSGRLFVRPNPVADLLPAGYDPEPWEFVVRLARDGEHKAVVVGELRRGAESRPLSEALLVTSSGWVVFADGVSRLSHFGAFRLLAALRSGGPVALAVADEAAFLERLYAQPALPRLELPPDRALQEVTGRPVPCLAIGAPAATPPWAQRGSERPTARLSFRYDGVSIEPTDPRGAIARVQERRLLRRDREAEAAAVTSLIEAGFSGGPMSRPGVDPDYDIAPQRLPAAVQRLVGAGWVVEAEGRPYRRAARFSLSVTSGVDWFDLAADIDFDGVSASLPEVLGALRRGESTVLLGDGTFGVLPEEWLKKYAPLADLGQPEGAHIRFGRLQVGLLDALLASEPEVSFDARFAKARDELNRFAGIRPAAAPGAFRGKLRPYQEAGLGWFAFLRRFGFGGCLADDMGLGKTIQVLAMLAGRVRQGRPSIAVVPKSLVWNWQQEAARFAPKLRLLAHVGPERATSARQLRDRLQGVHLLLTTYGVLRKDAPFLREVEADYLILDEAQAIKNGDSESAKAVRLLRGEHRLALSGTPIENHLGELWSLIEFLNPGMLGGARAFAGLAGSKRPDSDALAVVARALRPFILRRTKEEVAPELPAKHEETILCEMEAEQRRLYDELRLHYRANLLKRIDRDGLAKAKIQVLEALLRLRQVACHPALVDGKRAIRSSGKLDVLLARLEEVRREGHKALVFSQFTSFLALVRARLDAGKVAYEYLDGDTQDRAARVTRFQTDAACPVFLLSLKAGGVGLNLTAADYVFILDPWWNPAVEAQAVDRAHRIGQTKRVFVYRLLCRDSIEEKVAALQESKRELVSSVLDTQGSLMKTLDRETLEMLLG